MTSGKKRTFHWWLIGAGSGLVVLDLLFYFAMLIPTRQAFTAQETQYQSVVKKVMEKRNEVARLDSIQTHLRDASGNEASRFQQYIWRADDGFSSLIQFLTDAATHAGVQKSRTTFKASNQAQSGLLEVQVAVPLEGAYADIVKFINAVERSNHLLIIDTIALQSGQDNPDGVRLNLSMLAYMRGT